MARPLAVLGLALVALEAGLAALDAAPVAASLAVLVLAPGLALVPLLPAALRRRPLAAVAAAPALGFAASATLLVTAARLGVPIEGGPIRALLAALCLAALLLTRDAESDAPTPSRREAAALFGAVVLAALLTGRVVSGSPVPGNDWAKYLLYADEIRRQSSLLIDNPYWMLGVPFREDPAVPALYGGALAMSGAATGTLAHGIWLFALVGVLTVFALVRGWWPAAAALLAAALYAVVPLNHGILGWHGLANVAALAPLALTLAYLTGLLREGLAPRESAGFAIVLIALAATHRLTAALAAVAVVGVLAAALIAGGGERRRALLRRLAMIGGLCIALGAVVASDLIARQSGSGGTQSFEAYLPTKIDLGDLMRDLTLPFAVAAGLAAGALARRVPRQRALWPLAGLLVAIVVLAYAWIAHLPLSYVRMVYYLPLVLAPLTGIWLGTARRRTTALTAGVALVALTASLAWGQGANVRSFYGFANAASLQGLDGVAAQLRPGEVVVTDRCWSFLATWLLRTRTLAALEPADIGPAGELPFARQAQAILDGTPAGLVSARRLGVRFVIVDPTCIDADERPLDPPLAGEPIFVSRRLAVLELPEAILSAGASPRARTP